MLKTIPVFFLVAATFFSNSFIVHAQPTVGSSVNAESVCSSYKKTVGVVTFVDNRISQVRSPQEKIPVVLEERNGVMVPVLDVPDVSLTQERVIKAGDTIPFVSVVKNKSSLLLENTSLVFFVYKIEKDQEFLIDRFVPIENISLKAGEFKEFPFSWTVPAHFKKGEYIFRAYAVSANAFVFHGTSFEKDASVGNLRFFVEAAASTKKPFLVEIGQGGTTFSNMVLFPRTGVAPLTVTLKSDPSTAFKIPVVINVYSGMGTIQGDIVHSEERIIEVPSEGKASFEYLFNHADLSRYYVTVETKDDEVHSFGQIVVVRQDQGEPFISFASIDKSVLGATTSIPYVVCLNSFGQRITEGLSVVASLINSRGVVVESQEFAGGLLKNALDGSFAAQFGVEQLGFSVELKKNGKIIQRAEVTSSCSDCAQSETDKSAVSLIIIVTLVLSLFVVAGVYVKKRSLAQSVSVFKNEK